LGGTGGKSYGGWNFQRDYKSTFPNSFSMLQREKKKKAKLILEPLWRVLVVG